MIKEIYEFTTRIQSLTGRMEKSEYLYTFKNNDVIKTYLKYVLDPMTVYGIKEKKLDKYLGKTENIIPFQNLFDCFEYLKDNNTGKDVDIKLVASYIDSEEETYHDLIIKSITKSIKLGVTPKTVDETFGEYLFGMFEVQRGKSFSDYAEKMKDKIKSVTEKRNGIRCITFINPDGSIVNKSRQNQTIDGLNDIKNDMKNLPVGVYEGELVVKNSERFKLRDVLQKTIEIVNSDSENKIVNYEIFDYLTFDEFFGNIKSRKFFERRDTNPVNNLNSENVFMIPELIRTSDNSIIYELLNKIVDNGREGLMVNFDVPYKRGKTNAILKVKKHYTSDLKIIGFEEGKGKLKGTLGAFVVDYKGHTLNCGGIDDETRQKVWNNKEFYLGKIIEVKHEQESTNKKGGLSVEYPSFNCFREDKNTPSYAH